MSKKRRSKIDIVRVGNNEKDFRDVFELTLKLHAKGGYAPIDMEKAAENVYYVLSQGMTFVAYYKDEPVGTIGFIELAYWYSQETFLQDAWFYVDPEYRFKNVGTRLMIAARKVAEEKNKVMLLSVTDPDRRQKKTRMAEHSVIAGFITVGFTAQLAGKEYGQEEYDQRSEQRIVEDEAAEVG